MKFKINFKILTFTLIALAMTLVYQNCSRLSSSQSSSQSSWVEESEVNVTSVPYALLSSEQVLRSMASVTDTPVNGTITNEYNRGQSVLAGGFDLKMVTSPMLMATTNLASTFCNETLNKEIARPVDQRKLFRNIDFTKSAFVLTDANYQSTLQFLSSAFWGRALSENELEILLSAKGEFMTPLTDAEQKQTASSKNLMLYTCTAMLSSFDSISF